MYELALFAGSGGGILGGKILGWRTVCAVEINSYCQKILMQRQDDGIIEAFPIWDDVKTFGSETSECKDIIQTISNLDNVIITAGFPCQPYSTVGKKLGSKDERNLWPDTLRIIREVVPKFVLLENVPRLIQFNYFGKIIGDLAESGYDAEWDIISAAGVDAPHIRRRLWILGWQTKNRNTIKTTTKSEFGVCRTLKFSRPSDVSGLGEITKEWPDSKLEWWGKDPANIIPGKESIYARDCWGIESRMDRVVDGMANRVDRCEAIGNGQVPIVVAVAFTKLAERAGILS